MKYVVQSWERSAPMDLLTYRYGITEDQLMQANSALYSIPILPGMILEIPDHPTIELPEEGYIEYVVQPDDTLYNISHRFKLDLSRIISQNPQIKDPNRIWPGEIIYLIYLGY